MRKSWPARSSDWDMADWLSKRGQEASETFQTTFDAALARRARREPIAYIIGRARVLRAGLPRHPRRPRPAARNRAGRGRRRSRPWSSGSLRAERLRDVIDVGTGSGMPRRDAGPRVADLPVSWRPTCPLRRSPSRRTTSRASIWAIASSSGTPRSLATDVDSQFDLVVSNPPYVAERDRPGLMPDVRDFEPRGGALRRAGTGSTSFVRCSRPLNAGSAWRLAGHGNRERDRRTR